MFFREDYIKCYVPKRGLEVKSDALGEYYYNIIDLPKANQAITLNAFPYPIQNIGNILYDKKQ